eukprot:scaffold5637_cov47-Attheya_sp.AAC.4
MGDGRYPPIDGGRMIMGGGGVLCARVVRELVGGGRSGNLREFGGSPLALQDHYNCNHIIINYLVVPDVKGATYLIHEQQR